MSNFDQKFGPQPVHLLDEVRVLLVQAVAVFVVSMSIQPSFLCRPDSSVASPALSLVFACVVAISTVVVHRSFIKPP